MSHLKSFAQQDGEALQKARREAAERFYALGMSYLPGWFSHSFRKSLSGHCDYVNMEVVGPRPVTRRSLYIWLHECAHARLHYPLWAANKAAYKRKPKHVLEYEAERWAHEQMRAHGIAVPKAMTDRAKRYVARKITQAERRGAKSIDKEARAFASNRSKK